MWVEITKEALNAITNKTGSYWKETKPDGVIVWHYQSLGCKLQAIQDCGVTKYYIGGLAYEY